MDLTSYKSIESHLFVRIDVASYKDSPGASPISKTLLFSDRRDSFTIGSDAYVGLGNLLSITSASSEIRTSSGELSITIAGIPDTSIYEIVNSRIKGCPVRIYRGIFNATTGAFISAAGNPMTRYRGFVNNYALNEDYDVATQISSNTITLICNSSIDVLQNKTAGRKTNPSSEKKFFPDDLSMDRVPTLKNSTFDFGAKA